MSSPKKPLSEEAVWLALILFLGMVIRVWGLGTWEWEEDELYTLRDARDFGASAVAGGAPGITARPLYYLLQHLLLAVLPPTPLMLRLPPFLFGVLGILVTWWTARRVFGGYAGLIAAVLVALSPWHLYVSQFARYWSLVYLLAAATFGAFVAALQTDRRRDYLILLTLVAVGGVTHPTFFFPMFGVVVALHLVKNDTEFGIVWPSRRAWTNLWIPLAGLAVIGIIALNLQHRVPALKNADSRGLGPSLRLIPAMVQWMGVPIAAAAAASCAFLFVAGGAPGRRWAAMTVLGATGAFVLLLAASFRTGVYSDYGVAVLPLLFVAIAGAINLAATSMAEPARSTAALVATLTISFSVLPEVISHLSDGSKFDYRPAFETIRQLGPDRTVLGRIDALQPAEAPDLTYLPLTKYDRSIHGAGVWFITSQRRWGLREGGPRLDQFMNQHCRLVMAHERPRLDYRLYRVDLHWCGTDPVPTGRR